MALLNILFIYWSLSKNKAQEHISVFWIKFCAKKSAALGSGQKVGNDLLHDSELIATKVCSQISCKWNEMFESHVVESCINRTSLDFLFNHPLYYWPTIHNLILKICHKFQVLSPHFYRSMSSSMSIEWKLCKEKKKFNFNLSLILWHISIKCLQSWILEYLVWPWHSIWAI